MALTTRVDGATPSSKISAVWFNDFKNLFTGVMTDQPITFYYAPGASGSTPTLLLKTNGAAPLLRGLKPDGVTEAFKIDTNGVMTQQSFNVPMLVPTGASTAGRQIFTGTTTPSSANEGDIWIKA